jgi:hypothetical protein
VESFLKLMSTSDTGQFGRWLARPRRRSVRRRNIPYGHITMLKVWDLAG